MSTEPSLHRLGAEGEKGTIYTVNQYPDLVASVKVGSLPTSYYWYDAYGNVVKEEQDNAYVSNWTGTAGSYTQDEEKRTIYRAFNGFGQQEWELIQGGSTTYAKRVWNYFTTGEINFSWEGSPRNLTDYRYSSVATEKYLGNLITVFRGADGNGDGSLGTGAEEVQRERVDYTYESSFGRLWKTTLNGVHVTTYEYDPLDRITKETRPDGGYTSYTYDATMQVYGTWVMAQCRLLS